MSLKVKTTFEITKKISAFLSENKSRNYLGYHSPEHTLVLNTFLNDQPVWIYCVDENSNIVGVLVLRKKTGKYGTVYNSMPFFGANAGIIIQSCERENLIRELLFKEFKNLTEHPATLSTVIYTPFLEDSKIYEDILKGDDVLQKSTLYLDINNIDQWPSSRRGDIKRAIRSGVTVRETIEEDIDILYKIYKKDCEWKGIAVKPLSYFKDTLAFSKKDSGKNFLWSTAILEDNVIGGLLCICSAVIGSYTIPISDSKFRNLQSNALMIDNAVQKLKERGVRYFNFESSPVKDGPVYLYKKRWGSIETDYSLIINYPNGKEILNPASKEDILSDYPNYFVTPF